MWVIRSIDVFQYQAGRQAVSHAFNCALIPDFKAIALELHETETGDSISIVSLDEDRFISVLEEVQPYGMVAVEGYAIALPGPTRLLTFLHDRLFICIDESSAKFLDYVDNVELITVTNEHPITAKYWPLNMAISKLVRFVSADCVNSLFKCTPSHSISWCGCTLFQTIFYSVQAWDEQYFYIFGGRSARLEGKYKTAIDTILYRVSFTDLQEAKLLVTKAKVMKLHNPIQEFIEKYGFDI